MSPFLTLPFLRKDATKATTTPSLRRSHISKASISNPISCRWSMDIPDVAPPRPHHLSNYSTYLDYKDYREDVQVDYEHAPVRARLYSFEAEADAAMGASLRAIGI